MNLVLLAWIGEKTAGGATFGFSNLIGPMQVNNIFFFFRNL